MSQDCRYYWIGLFLTSLALLISVCLNVIFCFLRRRDYKHRAVTDTDNLLYPQPYQRESVSSPSMFEEPRLQDNPIYGNINSDRAVQEETVEDVCYESMAMPRGREERKPAEPDLNYASLDLNLAAKRKKKRRHQPGQNQRQLQARLSQASAQMGGLLEVEAEVEACLPSRGSSRLASCNSIYLNSQQVALETEERERERNLSEEEGGRQWD